MRNLGWIAVLATTAGALLGSAVPAAAGCTHQADVTVTSGGNLKLEYKLCDTPDLDQVRATTSSYTGVGNDGYLYCVPTSAMDMLSHLAQKGYLSKPADKDWTKQSNYSEMSEQIEKLAGWMGTDPMAGTLPPTDAFDGITKWIDKYGVSDFEDFEGIAVEKWFQSGDLYYVDPALMTAAAIGGALVMPGSSWVDSSGNANGGHFVALKTASGKLISSTFSLGVRDPFTDSTDDTKQTDYATDDWTLTDLGNGYWSIDGVPYEASVGKQLEYHDYLTIEPKKLMTIFGQQIVFDPPVNFQTGRPMPVRRFRTRAPVADIALSPEALFHPLLMRGDDRVYRLNRLTGRIRPFRPGPAGAAHLAIGGPNLELFVAGDTQIVSFNGRGRRVAATPLAHPLDALAFNERTGRLVGLSLADRQLKFFTPALEPRGVLGLQRDFIDAKGSPALAIGADGTLLLHRDGSAKISTVDASEQATAAVAGAFPAARMSTRRIHDVRKPRGLGVDDAGHLFVAVKGRLVELDADGNRVKRSAYAGLPAGSIVRVDRSYSNASTAPPAPDYVPPEVIAALKAAP